MRQRCHKKMLGLAVGAAAAFVTLVATPAQATSGATGDARSAAVDNVNVFVGTQDNLAYDTTESAFGDTSPGATTPFGMVNFNPNTVGTSRDQGGYHYDDSTLRGFSLNRLSGTGCTGNNGAEDFPIYPFTGQLNDGALPTAPTTDITHYYESFGHAGESASPGAYTVTADDGVRSELTASTRTGVGRFTYPADAGSRTLVFDAAGSKNGSEGSSVHVIGNRAVAGTTTVQALCHQGEQYRYTVHFYAEFTSPFSTAGTWTGSAVTPIIGLGPDTDVRTADTPLGTATPRDDVGAYVSFANAEPMVARIGLSYVSEDGARANMQAETAGRTFGQVRSAARDSWVGALDTIRVHGGEPAQLTTFYTALYHCLLHPNIAEDVDGSYTGYDRAVHQVRAGHHEYQTFSGWDIYRGEAQLIAMLFPDRGSDINQSIGDMAAQGGIWNLPHAYAGQNRGPGDSLDSILASMDAFGSTDYDRDGTLRRIVAAQTLVPNGTPDSANGVPDTNHRDGAFQYLALGFDTGPQSGSSAGSVPAAQTLEYATDDFGIAQLAKRLGEESTYERFMQRSQSWQNLFDPTIDGVNSRGKTGFVRADTRQGVSDANNQYFSQGSDYQYSWNTSQNVARLIAMKGGDAAALAQLNDFFSNLDPTSPNHVVPPASGQTVNPGHHSPFAYMTNEVDTQVPEVFNWLGRPDRAAEVNQWIRDELWFDNGPTGILGNDDLGGTSAWYVWSSLGLFPAIYGTADLVVSGPAFPGVSIHSAGSTRSYTIKASRQSRTNRYVTGMTVDGTASSKSWLPPSFARQGGTVQFTMSDHPNSWGTGAHDRPPSDDTGSNVYNSTGITTAGNGGQGSFDASDNSLPAEELPAAGTSIPLPGTDVTYRWPDVAPGAPDNWIPHGQVVRLAGTRLSSLSLLGAATNGPSRGTATVTYTDGSTQAVPVTFGDWTAGGVSGQAGVLTVHHRHARNGTQDDVTATIWGTTPIALDEHKGVRSVTLPTTTDTGIMHVFAVGTAPV